MRNRVVWGLIWVLAVGLFWAVLFLIVSKPEKVGFTPGSVKLTHAHLDGERVIVIDGNSANFLGQVQGIGYSFKGTNIFLDGFVVHFHPFSRLVTHQDWPLVFQEKGLAPGRYQVFYWSGERGYLPAGRFTVSPSPTGPPPSTPSSTERS
jgi:hypothetical protein